MGLLLTYTHSSISVNNYYYYTVVSVNKVGKCNNNIKIKWTPPSISYSSIVSYNLYMREYNSGNAFSVVYSGSNLEYDVELLN